MLRVLRIAHDLGHRGLRVAHAHLAVEQDLGRRLSATVHELGALAVYFVTGGAPAVEQPGG